MASAPPACGPRASWPEDAPGLLAPPAGEPAPGLVLVGLRAVMLGVPLAVLGSATGPYDDPKAWALPILVALTGFLWVLSHPNRVASRKTAAPGTRWLGAIVAAYALWWVITAVVGLAPAQSISGNFGRGLGLLTFGSTILLFPLVWSECRSSRAVAALVDAALLGSAPVCVLAFGQAAGWDPLPAAWDPVVTSLRVRSTFGQHIFLGSYLVLLIPLAVARIEWSLREREPGRAVDGIPALGGWVWAAAWVAGAVGLVALARWWDFAWWLLVPWGVTFALATARVSGLTGMSGLMPVPFTAALVASQVLVVMLSRARGAFLGLLAGLGVTALALLARRRGPRAAAMAAAGLVAVVAFVALLNVPGSPLEPLRALPLLSRLGRIADVHHSSPGWFRVQVWRGILDGWRRQLHGETLIPGLAPGVRSLVGYGLESQLVALDRLALPWLDVLEARGPGWRGQYVVDRSHNVVLDHLVTGGLVAVGLWTLLVASILAVGIARARAASAPGELAIRVGALGAIAAHLVEGQVGIVTPMPQALFWVAAALCTLPEWSEAPAAPAMARPRRTGWWAAAVVAAALATALVAWLQTQWLLASIAYGAGVRAGIADRPAEAHRSFTRSRDLAPWLALPAEAVAYSALRLASGERDAARRQALLREAEAALTNLRSGAAPGAAAWMLSGQVAFAQAMAGDRSRLRASLDAFEEAARRRPWDGPLLAQWAWALLEAGDPARARATAQRAVAGPPRTEAWLAWGVLARAARDLGDGAEADRAAARARSLAPPTARPVLESIISG
jgi:tetratricopeptide (TPR) repeat protein